MVNPGQKAAIRATQERRPISARSKRGSNLSRKQILELRHKTLLQKSAKAAERKSALKGQKLAQLAKHQNKKVSKDFVADDLRLVHEGLVDAIEALGEVLSPLSLFMCAHTAIRNAADTHKLPYLLTILTACFSKLSQGMLLRQVNPVLSLLQQLITEHLTTNALVVSKAMKAAQELLLAIDEPQARLLEKFRKLEPSKLSTELMLLYVASHRKVLERAALSAEPYHPHHSNASQADPSMSAAPLPPRVAFFLESLPAFVELVISNFTDCPQRVTIGSEQELTSLFQRALSPRIVESAEGQRTLNEFVIPQITNLFKPQFQKFWPLATDVVESLFNRLNYLKRTPTFSTRFTTLFPASVFLVRVLNKVHQTDDMALASKLDRALVAIGKGMPMSEFMELIPFNPTAINDSELLQGPNDELWEHSYILNVWRRCASHDSLVVFMEHVLPMMYFCQDMLMECQLVGRKAEMTKWQALLLQYCRVGVGFCQYPTLITLESFREFAKHAISLLMTPLVDTGANALHNLVAGYHKLATQAVQEDDEDEELGIVQDEAHDDGTAKDAFGKPLRTALEEDSFFLAMNDEGWNMHRFHNISQAQAQHVCENIFSKYSANIMPKLCNTLERHSSTAVLDAISSFAAVCSKPVMESILKGILELGTSIAATSGDAGAVSASTQANRQMVLGIAVAVLPQLPADHIAAMFNDIVEPVLLDPAPSSRLLQKRAYQLLYAMFEYRLKDIHPFFPRIAGLLAVGQQHVTISGLKMRIRCISWAIDACKMYNPDALVPTIRSTVGEVVLFSRERSSGAREMALEVLEKMQRYMVSMGQPMNALLHLVLAGLSGKTPLLISSTLVCLAKLISMNVDEFAHRDLVAVVSMAAQLMESTSQEVRAAAGTFTRMALKVQKRSPAMGNALREALPKILLAIALITTQPKVSSSTRMSTRLLLEKCIKRFGMETIEPMFPLGSKNFLHYTHKMLRRSEKQQEREARKKLEGERHEFEKLFLNAGVREKTIVAADGVVETADLLEVGALNAFTTAAARAKSRHSALGPILGNIADLGNAADEPMHLEFSHDGKLRILTKEEKAREVALQRRQALAQKLLGKGQAVSAEALNKQRGVKRGRAAEDLEDEKDDFQNEELIRRYGSSITNESVQTAAKRFGLDPSAEGSSRANANALQKMRDQADEKRALKRARLEEDIKKGDEFRTERGEGDVKRGQGVDPFAYVPLNRRFMNKRFQRQALQRFETVIHKGSKGYKAKVASERAAKGK